MIITCYLNKRNAINTILHRQKKKKKKTNTGEAPTWTNNKEKEQSILQQNFRAQNIPAKPATQPSRDLNPNQSLQIPEVNQANLISIELMCVFIEF
jgi:hypothetical protein